MNRWMPTFLAITLWFLAISPPRPLGYRVPLSESEKAEIVAVWSEDMFLRNQYKTSTVHLDPLAKELFQFKKGLQADLLKYVKKNIELVDKEEEKKIRFNDKSLQKALARAQALKKKVEQELFESDVDPVARLDLLSLYSEALLLPIRDAFIMSMDYDYGKKDKKRGDFNQQAYRTLEKLLVSFPGDVAKPGSTEEQYLKYENSTSAPLGLRVVSSGNMSKLDFENTQVMARDMVALLSTNTAENYLRAVKLMTIQGLLQEMQIYTAYVGDRDMIEPPLTCQSHEGGKLPPQVHFESQAEQTNIDMLRLLEQNGLIHHSEVYSDLYQQVAHAQPLMASPQSFYQAYYDFTLPDLSFGGFGDILPFERIKRSELALKGELEPFEEVMIDDVSEFDFVYETLGGKLFTKLKQKLGNQMSLHGNTPERRRQKQQLIEEKLEWISGLFGVASESWSLGEDDIAEDERIDVLAMRHPIYFIEEMKKREAVSWIDIVPEEIIEKLYQQKMVIEELPSLNAPDAWLRWGLYALANELEEHQHERLHQAAFDQYCRSNSSPLCGEGRKSNPASVVKRAKKALESFVHEDSYTLRRKIDKKKLQPFYAHLRDAWRNLVDKGRIETAHTDQWSFLEGQIEAGNAWGLLKLTYIIMKDKLNKRRSLYPDKDITFGRGYKRKAADPKRLAIDKQIELIDVVGDVYQLERPLQPFHANSILTKTEKRQVFKKIDEDLSALSRHLFKTEARGGLTHTSDLLAKVATAHPHNLEESKQLVTIIDGSILGRQAVDEHLENIWNSPMGELAESLYRLMQVETDEEELNEKIQADLEIAQKLYQNFGEVSASYQDFLLAFHQFLKIPIYQHIMREAAFKRREKLAISLGRLCETTAEDVDQLKEQFYLTLKSHDQVNKMLGLPSVPERLKDDLGNWSKGDIKALLWGGVGGGVPLVAAIVLSSGCVGATGGFCAPLAAGLLASVATASSLKASAVEFDQTWESRKLAKHVEDFHKLGWTREEGIKEIKRGYAAGIAELVFVIPTIGLMGRALMTSGRVVTGVAKHGLKGMTKQTYKTIARRAAREANFKYKGSLLGLKGLSQSPDEAGSLLSRVPLVRDLFAPANMSYAASEVAEAYSKRLSYQLGNNPKRLHRALKAFDQKIPKAKKTLAKLEAKKAAKGKLGFVSQMRFDSAQKLLKHEQDLKRMMNVLEGYAKSGKSLNQFFAKNGEKLAAVMNDMPLRLAEIPSYIWQGAPVVATKSFFSPRFNDSIVLKRLSDARSDLLYELAKKKAANTFGLDSLEMTASSGQVLRSLAQASDSEVLKGTKAGTQFQIEARKFFKGLAGDINQALTERSHETIQEKELIRILTAADTPEERAMADAYLKMIKLEDKLELKKLPETGYQAIKVIQRHGHDPSTFDFYLNVLKINLLSRNLDAWAF